MNLPEVSEVAHGYFLVFRKYKVERHFTGFSNFLQESVLKLPCSFGKTSLSHLRGMRLL